MQPYKHDALDHLKFEIDRIHVQKMQVRISQEFDLCFLESAKFRVAEMMRGRFLMENARMDSVPTHEGVHIHQASDGLEPR